ncbi:polypeptide N-acetylgalactosaminyltransferase 16-like protein [Labeo rohita]|uniref:Polypeptide N-acetylgalactosaminyltransferase 16-like protein n=1 Tax=Labeo rohita TaxID=84645 RepID=A0A498N612_LABRO|nr:polypeptide N-acetylgalactosaminyltransferase 16-like protein [Labeo rohita]
MLDLAKLKEQNKMDRQKIERLEDRIKYLEETNSELKNDKEFLLSQIMGAPWAPASTEKSEVCGENKIWFSANGIKSQARNFHKPEDHHKVAQFTCHDTATADQFYALRFNPTQALEHRCLFELALEGKDPTPETPERPHHLQASAYKKSN